MSPQVTNFVHDLVEMARAMDTLPVIEAENAELKTQIDTYAKTVQDRELAIFEYKEQIEALNAKVRSLEVERDDATFRVIEAEDKAHKVLGDVAAIEALVKAARDELDPPKPQPEKVILEPTPPAVEYFESLDHPVHTFTAEGASEPAPVVPPENVYNWTPESTPMAEPKGESAADPIGTTEGHTLVTGHEPTPVPEPVTGTGTESGASGFDPEHHFDPEPRKYDDYGNVRWEWQGWVERIQKQRTA